MIDKSMCEPGGEARRANAAANTLLRVLGAAILSVIAAHYFGAYGYLATLGLYLYIEGLRHDR